MKQEGPTPMSDDEKIGKCVIGHWPDCVDVECGFPCRSVAGEAT